jgi:hypothetical protein
MEEPGDSGREQGDPWRNVEIRRRDGDKKSSEGTIATTNREEIQIMFVLSLEFGPGTDPFPPLPLPFSCARPCISVDHWGNRDGINPHRLLRYDSIRPAVATS